MRRKIVLSISGVLIALDIGVSAVLVGIGALHLATSLDAIAAFASVLHDFARPLPSLHLPI